jgi:DNA polymerase I-like protein with 3'-5' exonuclease and polymerase domains
MPYIDIQGEIPQNLPAFSNYQAYNCLDASITAQLLPELLATLTPNTARTYRREFSLVGLCLEMSSKGLPIDQFNLAELLYALEKDAALALRRLHQFCEAVSCRPINPRSTVDVPYLFYEHLQLPTIWEFDRKTKSRKRAADIKALEKLRLLYPSAAPFVNAILAYREAAKMGSVFKRGLEPKTAALRCSFSPSGTDTGRMSSQQNVYGRGTNAQNLTDRVRQVIAAPKGWAIVNLDLKTAESIAVGFISGCRAYISACLSGDVHTAAARLNWPGLAWTGDLRKDKAIAEAPYYRMFSYRDMAKRGGHGTNYYGTPKTMAAHLKLPTAVLEDFQQRYFRAFPEISAWHLQVIAQIQQHGVITNALHRERRFWGRSDDPATYRSAIAFNPQSLVADVMNEGLLQVQRWLLRNAAHVLRQSWCAGLSAQVHDAGVFLLPIDELPQLIPQLQQHLLYPVDFGELGVMSIPSDVMYGKRWNKAPKKNGDRYTLQGLRDYNPSDDLSWLHD